MFNFLMLFFFLIRRFAQSIFLTHLLLKTLTLNPFPLPCHNAKEAVGKGLQTHTQLSGSKSLVLRGGLGRTEASWEGEVVLWSHLLRDHRWPDRQEHFLGTSWAQSTWLGSVRADKGRWASRLAALPANCLEVWAKQGVKVSCKDVTPQCILLKRS